MNDYIFWPTDVINNSNNNFNYFENGFMIGWDDGTDDDYHSKSNDRKRSTSTTSTSTGINTCIVNKGNKGNKSNGMICAGIIYSYSFEQIQNAIENLKREYSYGYDCQSDCNDCNCD